MLCAARARARAARAAALSWPFLLRNLSLTDPKAGQTGGGGGGARDTLSPGRVTGRLQDRTQDHKQQAAPPNNSAHSTQEASRVWPGGVAPHHQGPPWRSILSLGNF